MNKTFRLQTFSVTTKNCFLVGLWLSVKAQPQVLRLVSQTNESYIPLQLEYTFVVERDCIRFFIFHFISQCCLCRSLCWFVKTPGTGHVPHSRIASTTDLFHRRSACFCKVLSLERNFTFLRTSLLVCKFVYNFMMISVKHSICNSGAWQFDFTDSFVFDFFFLNWECSHARKS